MALALARFPYIFFPYRPAEGGSKGAYLQHKQDSKKATWGLRALWLLFALSRGFSLRIRAGLHGGKTSMMMTGFTVFPSQAKN
jgi:hypothetical protein